MYVYVQGRAIRGWLYMVDWRKRMRLILNRAVLRLTKRQLILAWESWWAAIENRKLEEQLTTKEQLVVGAKTAMRRGASELHDAKRSFPRHPLFARQPAQRMPICCIYPLATFVSSGR